MTQQEAILEVMRGRKARFKNWNSNWSLVFHNEGFYLENTENPGWLETTWLPIDSGRDTDWEIVE